MKGRRHHRWIYPPAYYPRAYTLPRPGKPARCACGATLHYETRRKEDAIYTSPQGERLVNPRVMPPCPVLK